MAAFDWATGYSTGSLHILDSLGRAPASAHPSNASPSASGARRRFLPVAGASWDVDLADPIAFIGRF
jgi:hypothetical protein